MTYWYLILFNFIATFAGLLLFVGADSLKEYLISKKTIEKAQEEAQKIIHNTKIKMHEMINKANQEKASIEKEIEEKKRRYHNFAIHANQTADYIAEVINECVVKNKNLIAINYSILQHLYNKAQASNQGKRAIRKFEKFRNQIMQIVEQNIIDPSLQERVKKEILTGISDKEIIRLENIEYFLKGKRKSI